MHLLSGVPDSVERVLNAWRVPRARNEHTGDVSHPSVVYVVGPDGRIAYVVAGGAEDDRRGRQGAVAESLIANR